VFIFSDDDIFIRTNNAVESLNAFLLSWFGIHPMAAIFAKQLIHLEYLYR